MDWGDTDDLADLGMDLDGGEEDEEYVGEDLKALREERRMSRSDVASALGIPLVNVFKVEEDEIPLTGAALEKFKKLIA